MSEKPKVKPQNNETPPAHASLQEQEKWWQDHGVHQNKIQIKSNRERICPLCGAINTCTGGSDCTSCRDETALDNAERKKLDIFQPQ